MVWRCACGLGAVLPLPVFNFLHFFNLVLFCCDAATSVTVLYQTFWNFADGFFMVWRCVYAFRIILSSFFINFFHFFNIVFQVWLVLEWYLVGTTHPTVFHPSFLNYAYLFYMVWRCACGFGFIIRVFFINFSHFFDLVFFQCQLVLGRPRWLSWMRRPTGDQEVAGSTPTEVGNILSWRLIVKYFLKSFSPFRWFKKGSCQFLAKECAHYWLTA